MRVTHPRSTIVATLVVMLSCAVFATAAGASTPSVNYGPISHSGLKSAGPAPTGLKLTLQIGLIANNSGIQSAVKSASDPASSTYGKYLSLSTLASKYGASSSKINAVEGPFKSGGSPVSTDVTHLRTTATVSIGRAKQLFGTSWTLYQTGTPNQLVALPTNTPKLPNGLSGNVDTVAGMRLNVTQSTARAYSGGTPTQTGADNPGCLSSTDPASLTYGQGLFPNQILTAYGIAPLPPPPPPCPPPGPFPPTSPPPRPPPPPPRPRVPSAGPPPPPSSARPPRRSTPPPPPASASASPGRR